MVEVIYWGRSRREYRKRDGGAGEAHNVTVLQQDGTAGELFVPKALYDQLDGLKQGDRVQLVPELGIFKGEAKLRVGAIRPVKG